MRRGAVYAATVVLSLAVVAPSAQAGGPHFMVEGNLGRVTGLSDGASTEAGWGGGVLVGVGGRISGSLPRFYLMAEYATGGYGRLHQQNLRPLALNRRVHEIGLVGRVVLPIVPQLRVFADAGFMAVNSRTQFEGAALAVESTSELEWGFRLAAGLQYRPAERFSLGLRLSTTAVVSGLDSATAPGWLVGFEPEAGHAEATLQLTVYF